MSGVGVVLFALRREATPFRGRLRASQLLHGGPCWARLHHLGNFPLLLLITGMGPVRTLAALEWLLSSRLPASLPQPAFVVSAGFAAGLDEQLRVGDV